MAGGALFAGKLSVVYCDNMDAWLKYHVAFILPVVYLCYKTGCNLKRSTRGERKLMLDAVGDGIRHISDGKDPARCALHHRALPARAARDGGNMNTIGIFLEWLGFYQR